MSMHSIPLTPLEAEGLKAHGLDIGVPSQLSDAFRQGIKYALENSLRFSIPIFEGYDQNKPVGVVILSRFVEPSMFQVLRPAMPRLNGSQKVVSYGLVVDTGEIPTY